MILQGVGPLIKFSQRRGLARSQFLERELLRKRGMTFFRTACSFYIKNKLKSEIFNDKKKFINIEFKRRILTMNLVTSKR